MTADPAVSEVPLTVSIVIATYNRVHYLPTALDSILNQTRLPEEIIVVDDGSTDETSEVMQRYQSQIRCFRTENGGKSSALNFAIPLAQGSHILIFDDDDVALPDALQSHLQYLTTHPDVDFTYSTNYKYSGSTDIWQRDKWTLKTVPDWPVNEFLLSIMHGMHTMLPGMLIPKRCFLEVGLFDATLLRAQDLDILLKLAYRYRAKNILKATFVFRDHSGPRGTNPRSQTAAQRSAVQLQYEQQIYRRLRNNYPLASYLPHEPGTDFAALTAAERGHVLLQRSCIMMRQGLTEEALEDLKAGLRCLKASTLIVGQISPILSKAVNIDPRRFPQPYRLILGLRKTLKVTDTSILAVSFARGIYWSLKKSLQRRAWSAAMISIRMLGLLIVSGALDFFNAYRKVPSVNNQ